MTAQGQPLTRPTLSIVIPTRNRPEFAANCVSKVLGCAPGEFELILVDQSDGAETGQALAFASSDARFRYLPSGTRGAGAARNAGIEQAQGDLVAFTDDDCIVAPDWVRGIRRIFDSDKRIDAMFGRVRAPAGPPGTWAATFAASPRDLPPSGYPPFPRGWGMSANLACRREVFDKIGTFDPNFGPGSPLKAAEDSDLFIRMRKAGLNVVYAEEVCVEHVFLRGEETLRALLCGYYFSAAAVFVKHARMGDAAISGVLLRLAVRLLARGCLRLLQFRGFDELKNFACLIRGALASFGYRIDADRRLYLAPGVDPRASRATPAAGG